MPQRGERVARERVPGEGLVRGRGVHFEDEPAPAAGGSGVVARPDPGQVSNPGQVPDLGQQVPDLGQQVPGPGQVHSHGQAPGPGHAPLRQEAGRPDVAGPGDTDRPVIGVLALQGDVLEHLRMLSAAGASPRPVKRADELDGLDGILIPGGESTTIGKLATLYGLLDPLRDRIGAGMPAFGTCAGAILLGSRALRFDGRPVEQPLLAVMDTVVRRNAFGRQVDSFEADLDVAGVTGPEVGGPMHAVFIRAPWIEQSGPAVDVLAEVPTPLGAKVVVARQGHVLVSAFHPELTEDGRLHRYFVEWVVGGDPTAAAG